MQLEHGDHGQRARRGQPGEPAQPDPGQRDQAQDQGQHQHDHAEVGLGGDERERDRGEAQRGRHRAQRRAAAGAVLGGDRVRPQPGPRIIASTTMIAILAYSDGSIWKPPGSAIQDWAPLTVLPSGVSTSEQAEGGQDRGGSPRTARSPG